jgi:hypothetical protein
MSVSQAFKNDTKLVEAVVAAYMHSSKPTVAELAEQFQTTMHNVQWALKKTLPSNVYIEEKRLRYSRSKMGANNPMLAKYGALHHGFKGDVMTKDGYLQRKVGRRYELVHRLLIAQALGLRHLPKEWEVHHIDGVKTNNDLDNLALVTPAGHRRLHAGRSQLSKSPLWVQHLYTTSP